MQLFKQTHSTFKITQSGTYVEYFYFVASRPNPPRFYHIDSLILVYLGGIDVTPGHDVANSMVIVKPDLPYGYLKPSLVGRSLNIG